MPIVCFSVNVGISTAGSPHHNFLYFSLPWTTPPPLSFFPFFFFYLPPFSPPPLPLPMIFITTHPPTPHNPALWSRWQILPAFQSGAKNNHLFFYSHWLRYNAATLSGRSRGQSIISPLAIRAAVWLLGAKHKDKARLPLCSGARSLFFFSFFFFPRVRIHPSKEKQKIAVIEGKKKDL